MTVDPAVVGDVGVLLVHVVRAATEGQAERERIGRPQVGAVPGVVRELVAVVRRGHVDATGAGPPGHGTDVAIVLDDRIQVGVSPVDAPALGDLAGEADFHAVHLLLAGILGGAVVDDDARIVHHRMERGGGQVQPVVQQVPLHAQFEVGGVLRLQVLDRRADAVGAVATVHARRRGRGAVAQVDAAIGARLEHHAGLVVDEVGPVAQHHRRGGGRRGDLLGFVVVMAQAQVEQPLRGQFQRVEEIHRRGPGLLADVQRRVAARDRVHREPGIVRVGVGERCAVVLRRRTDQGGQAGGGAAEADRRGNHVAAAPGLFVAVFDAGAVAVLHGAGGEGASQAQLVGQGPGSRIAAVDAPPQGAVGQRVVLAVVGLGPEVVVAGVGVAQHVAQLVGAEGIAGIGGADVGLGLLEIAVLQSVVVVAVRHQRRTGGRAGDRAGAAIREAAGIGQVVGCHVVMAQHELKVAVEAERDRGREAPAADIGHVTAGDVRIVGHQVQACGDAVSDHRVGVHGGAHVVVGAQAEAGPGFVLQFRGLADQVDAAAAGISAAVGRTGALDHFHLLQVEHLAGLHADIAHAVDEGVALAVEAADEGTVTGGVAAFAGAKGDARHHAQGVLQAGGAGFLQQLCGHDRHGLGGVQQFGGELGRGRVEPAAAHLHRIQFGGRRLRR